MKVAIVTNDGDFISQHFGRSRYYKIYTIEDNAVTSSELRERGSGHFARQPSGAPEHSHGPHENPQDGHGYGAEARDKHATMAAEISDCQVLIAGGMGAGAYEHFKAAGLEVILTDYASIEEAVTAWMEGKIRNLASERTH